MNQDPPKTPPCWLIAGCGYIGRALACALGQANPPQLLAWSRRGAWAPNPQEGLPNQAPCPLEAVDLDSDIPPFARAQLARVSTLVLSYAPGRGTSATEREALYLGAPRRLLAHLPRHARVIALSSTSALPDLDAELDESCTLAPQSERGKLQRAAEDQLWTLANQHGLELIILRLAGIYGPGRALTRLYGRPQSEPRPGDGHIATNLVHRDDVIQAILKSSTVPSPVHQLFHVCTASHPSRRTMIEWAHQLQGFPPPAWSAAPGQGPVRGKRVQALRIQAAVSQGGLGLRFLHPSHAPIDGPPPGPALTQSEKV